MCTAGNGNFEMVVEHASHPDIARAYARSDMEYIRKCSNAYRNNRNSILTNGAGRTYESMKTLIDVIEIFYNLDGVQSIMFYPEKTSVRVCDETLSELVTSGVIHCKGAVIAYTFKPQYIRHPDDGSEQYCIYYYLDLTEMNGHQLDYPLHLEWRSAYDIDVESSHGLGYAENFVHPSKLAENLYNLIESRVKSGEEKYPSDAV